MKMKMKIATVLNINSESVSFPAGGLCFSSSRVLGAPAGPLSSRQPAAPHPPSAPRPDDSPVHAADSSRRTSERRLEQVPPGQVGAFTSKQRGTHARGVPPGHVDVAGGCGLSQTSRTALRNERRGARMRGGSPEGDGAGMRSSEMCEELSGGDSSEEVETLPCAET